MMPDNLCLNCMAGVVKNGICTSCGRPLLGQRSEKALPLGFRLRDYTFGRVLGEGGFGITYLAWDHRNGRRVAVKELFPPSAVTRGRDNTVRLQNGDPDLVRFFSHVNQRFLEEAKNIRSLSAYPEIIRVYDVFQELNTSYYVMEYLEGMNLTGFCIKKGHVNWDDLKQPIWDVLQALQILHRNGLIHRDISPDNIFALKNGGAKLIDFGSARNERADHFTTWLKRDFAPWEQFHPDEEQKAWTDTFSLSASLYFMLSNGEKPLVSHIRWQKMQNGEDDPLAPLSSFAPDAPSYVVDAVMKGMSIPQESRFQNVNEMRSALFPSSSARFAGTQVLICVEGRFRGKRIALDPGKGITLGRGSENAVSYPMDTKGISRKHCELFMDAHGGCYVRDLQSRFGTRMNGTLLQPMAWCRLRKGDILTVGADSYRLI